MKEINSLIKKLNSKAAELDRKRFRRQELSLTNMGLESLQLYVKQKEDIARTLGQIEGIRFSVSELNTLMKQKGEGDEKNKRKGPKTNKNNKAEKG